MQHDPHPELHETALGVLAGYLDLIDHGQLDQVRESVRRRGWVDSLKAPGSMISDAHLLLDDLEAYLEEDPPDLEAARSVIMGPLRRIWKRTWRSRG